MYRIFCDANTAIFMEKLDPHRLSLAIFEALLVKLEYLHSLVILLSIYLG